MDCNQNPTSGSIIHSAVTRTVTGSSPIGGAKAQVRGLANDQRRLLMGRAPHKATQEANSRAYATVAGAVALMLGGMVLVGALTDCRRRGRVAIGAP